MIEKQCKPHDDDDNADDDNDEGLNCPQEPGSSDDSSITISCRNPTIFLTSHNNWNMMLMVVLNQHC